MEAKETPKAKAEGAKTTQKEEVVEEKATRKAKVAEVKVTEKAKDTAKEEEKVDQVGPNLQHPFKARAIDAAVRATKGLIAGKRRMFTATVSHLPKGKVQEERTRSNKLMATPTMRRMAINGTVGTASSSSKLQHLGPSRPILVEA